jgi:phosphatidylserine/phosphatidylglycerophosphate/cardiolipin synthase-like enzyme
MGLLSVLGPRDRSYSGRGMYRHVERVLGGERNIMIASPYIDDYYASYLLRHSRGKSIRILSSSIRPEAAKRLKGRRSGPAAAFALAVAALDVALIASGNAYPPFIAASLIIAVAALVLSLRRRNGIALRVPKGFVHAKMYIGDNLAVVGSANLTYAGMHENVEHIDVISDRGRINDLKKQFMGLWNSA